MEEYKFESIYQFINIVYKSVKNEVELWGYDKEEFINSCLLYTSDAADE